MSFNLCLLGSGLLLGDRLPDGDLNVHIRLDGDGGDLLHDLAGRLEVDDALVDAHLETIPGLGTLTARSPAGGDAEALGGHTDRTTDGELLGLGAVDEVSTNLLEVADVPGGEGDADGVHGSLLRSGLLDGSRSGHIHRYSFYKKKKKTHKTKPQHPTHQTTLLQPIFFF